MSQNPSRLNPNLVVRKEDVPASVQPPTAPRSPPREGLTIRVLASDNERLRALAYKTRLTKQALLDEAIRRYLDDQGA